MSSLTREGCVARREHLIKTANADLLIVTNPRHIFYLTGMYITPLALSAWGPNFLLIEASTGKTTLLVHNQLTGASETACVDKVEIWQWYNAKTDPGVDPYRKSIGELDKQLTAFQGKRMGIEFGWMPFGVPIEQPIDLTSILWNMRRRKYPDELVLIREAVEAVDAGHQAARQTMKPGISELDIYNAVHAGIVKAAKTPVLLMGDFVSGDRAFGGGGPATDRVLQAGELMIIDVFPIVNGYRADYTATLSVDGKLTDKQRALETALQEAMAAGESMLKPGNRAGDVHRAVKDKFVGRGFGEGFHHHAGHGLGLGHPDAPYFVPNSDEILIAGDVVTLEPGSYGPDFGARIENNYLITENGFERLSHHNTKFA
jgi:Xaa-Pro aminopeptidase